MFHLSTLSHLAANAKNALIPRTPLTPLQNLQQINSSITKLTNLISTWSGSSLLSAAPISSQSATLGVELKNAIVDVKVSSFPLSSSSGEKGSGGGGVGGGEKEDEEKEEEERLLLEYITSTLRPNIEVCMQTMKSRKEEFGKCGLGGTVSGDLRDLRKLTGELGRSLRERVVGKGEMREGKGEEDEDESEKVMKLIDEDFEDAIQWFAS